MGPSLVTASYLLAFTDTLLLFSSPRILLLLPSHRTPLTPSFPLTTLTPYSSRHTLLLPAHPPSILPPSSPHILLPSHPPSLLPPSSPHANPGDASEARDTMTKSCDLLENHLGETNAHVEVTLKGLQDDLSNW